MTVHGCTEDEENLQSCVCEDCSVFTGESIWTAPRRGNLCVSGDLVIQGRTRDELGIIGSIAEITGSLVVHDNPSLTELPVFPQLARIGGSISISDHESLAQIHGFPALADIEGGLYVGENEQLASVQLGNKVRSLKFLSLVLNPMLTTLAGFDQVDTVAGALTVRRNPRLTTLRFPQLVISWAVAVGENEVLATLELPALREVANSLNINGNPILRDVHDLMNLEVVGTVSIAANQSLESIDIHGPWAGLGLFTVADNLQLRGITGSPQTIFSANASLSIRSNPALRTMSGFAGVPAASSLNLSHNPNLETMPTWPGLTNLWSLTLVDNEQLEAPSAWLPQLRAIERLSIFRNPALASEAVDDLLAAVKVHGTTKVGNNGGEFMPLDPCPWLNDYYCDEDQPDGSGLCVEDEDDCL